MNHNTKQMVTETVSCSPYGVSRIAAGIVMMAASGLAGAGTPLYPDLYTVRPTNLYFDVVTINGTGHYVLRFDNTFVNKGPGRLELEGQKQSKIYQRIYDKARGGILARRIFLGNDGVYHRTHRHYHIKNVALYELFNTDPDPDVLVTKGPKTSFCIIDVANYFSPSSAQYRSCNRSLQGLSVGWADVYGAYLPDQWVDLGTAPLPDGHYRLRSTVNPGGKTFYEGPELGSTGKKVNSAQICLTVSGNAISTKPC